MKVPEKDGYGIKRLQSKNVKNAIIQRIAQDFNLTPIIAEAYFRQISAYFNEHLNIKLTSGQIAYEAVAAEVSDYVNEFQTTTGRILPTRGNIHDLSGAITHKREIIALYLQGYLTPTIASKTNHSKEAVDRYIRDFEAVRTVYQHGITELDQIVHITKLSKRVTQQYLDLIPEKNKLTKSKQMTISQIQQQPNAQTIPS